MQTGKSTVSGTADVSNAVVVDAVGAVDGKGTKVRTMLKARLGNVVYSSWFKSMELESFDGRTVKVSVPVKFVRNWITEHYSEHLLACA
jgi:chromosomal replication initiator protein